MGCINHPAMFFFVLLYEHRQEILIDVQLSHLSHLLHSWSAQLWHHGASCNLWCIAHRLLRIREGLAEGIRRNPKDWWGWKHVETRSIYEKGGLTSLFSSKSMRCQEWKEKLIMCIWLQIQFQSSLHECCENQASMCWVLTHVAIMLLGKICVLLVSPFSHLKQER